jgi:hypothetical protein
LNGSGEHRSNVESLDEARRRAAARKRQQAADARASGHMLSARDWIVGGIIILLALAMVATWLSGLAGIGAPPR